MKYLGREFKNAHEIREWSKQGNIAYYKKLVNMFIDNPSMDLSIMMGQCADILVQQFGMTYDEVEQIEISCIVA